MMPAQASFPAGDSGPHVWVVTTTFNRVSRLATYLGCVANQTYPYLTLVLVDHGSQHVVDHVKIPESVVLLMADSNNWWTGAVNIGVSYVLNRSDVNDDDLIVLQNDDSCFGADFITELVTATNRGRRVAGSVAVDRDSRKILHANLCYERWRATYRYLHYGEEVAQLGNTVLSSHVLKGRGTAYPVHVVRQIGLLDERLPQYRSDHEFAHRARRRGFDVVVTPLAVCETSINTQARVTSDKLLASFWQVLFSRRSPANIPDMVRYFYICFGVIEGTYGVLVNGTRTIIISTAQLIMELRKRDPDASGT